MTQVGLRAVFSVVLFFAMPCLLEVGHRTGLRARKEDPFAASGTSAVDGAVFALLGLMIAFTFSGAASRFDARRTYITQETNAIGLGRSSPGSGPRRSARCVRTSPCPARACSCCRP